MIHIGISFDHNNFENLLNIHYLLNIHKYGRVYSSRNAKEEFWKHFEMYSFPGLLNLPWEFYFLLMIPKSDGIILKQVKFFIGKYIHDQLDCLKFFRLERREWLQDLLPILIKTIEQISRAPNKNITSSMLKNLLEFMLKSLWKELPKFWLLFPYAMTHFHLSFDYDKLELYLGLSYWRDDHLNQSESEERSPEMKEDFWRHFEIDSLPEFLPSGFSVLKILKSESVILKQFKFYVGKYITEYRVPLTTSRYEWLQNLLPILEETIEHISQASNENITFSMLGNLFRFFLTDSFFNESKKSWLSVPCVMLHISISFDYDKLKKYLNIDYLLKTYTDFDSRKLSKEMKEDFWRHFEIDSLPEFLPSGFSVLKIPKSESVILKQFKFYSGKYITEHFDWFSFNTDFLQDLLPILEKTIEQISQASNENITFSTFENFFRYLLTDLHGNASNVNKVMEKLSDRFIDSDILYWFHKYFDFQMFRYQL